MKRWCAVGFIAAYLTVLVYGLGCHILNWGTWRHPMMYYVVWDMFCGWSSYTGNVQVIGESESERFYELSPGPWGELNPWGSLGRRHYDPLNNHLGRLAANTLKHTRHEPITRVFVIEECWPKKYDLPDFVWNMRYDCPKDRKVYRKLRAEITPEGIYEKSYIGWMEHQNSLTVSANPRLQQDAFKGRSLFLVEERPGRDMSIESPIGMGHLPGARSLNSPSGN